MTTVNCRVGNNDQNGAYNASTGQYENAGTNGNYNFVPGSVATFRFHTMIPTGVTLNSATLKLWYNSKFGDQNMSSNHTVYAEVATKNSAPLVQGELYTSRRKAWIVTSDVNILANTGNNAFVVDVTKVIKDALAFGLVPGGHITFFVLCNTESGDMNWKLDIDGAPPELIIDYTGEDTNGEFWDFNLLKNPDFSTDVDTWGTNVFFNAFAVNGYAVTRDTTFLRDGRPTLKWTCPTPEAGKACGPVTGALANVSNTGYIFCGWIYIPSSLNATVNADFYFFAGSRVIDGPRDQWIPFSTNVANATGFGWTYPTIGISEGFLAGQNIWLSDCAVYRSNIRQMPFANQTPNQAEVTHYVRNAAGRGPITRRIKPRVHENSANPALLKPRKKFALHSSGLWKYTSTTRQSLSWDGLEANGMTWDQLEATGKTWAQLESVGL